jgi:exoribonuclease II
MSDITHLLKSEQDWAEDPEKYLDAALHTIVKAIVKLEKEAKSAETLEAKLAKHRARDAARAALRSMRISRYDLRDRARHV